MCIGVKSSLLAVNSQAFPKTRCIPGVEMGKVPLKNIRTVALYDTDHIRCMLLVEDTLGYKVVKRKMTNQSD